MNAIKIIGKIFGIALFIVGIMLAAWLVASFFDVNVHNLTPGEESCWWNFFKMFVFNQ